MDLPASSTPFVLRIEPTWGKKFLPENGAPMNPPRAVSYCFLTFLILPLVCFAQSRNIQDLRGSLNGKVVIAGDAIPASQVRVDVRLLGENWKASVFTNRDGEFSVQGLVSGTYFVTVDAPGCEPFEETMQIDPGTAPLVFRLHKTSQPPADNTAPTVSAHELSIPEKARKAFNKGCHLLAANDSAGSIVEFQRAIKAFPGFYEAYHQLGVAELDLDHEAAAEAAFRKSIELSAGRYAPPESGLSLVLCFEKEFAEAEAVAQVDLQLDPADATGHYALASVFLATNRLAEAEKSALQAILHRPAFPMAYLLLGQIHQHQDNPVAVVADLDAYLKLDPDSPRSAKVRAIRAETQNALAQQTAGSALAKANP
jgi:Flp pilus assembly protein TadD